METVENQVSETQDTSQASGISEAASQDTDSALDAANTQTQQQTENQTLSPFQNGKEKFKVNGQDHEWDWETTKRYAQLGRSGQVALEKAAQVERKSRDTYQQLLHGAKSDPVGLIRILRGDSTWTPQASAATKGAHGQDNQAGTQDSAQLEYASQQDERIRTLEETLERQAIGEERKAIETELDDSVKKYPALNNKFYRDYVKSQYARSLRQGLNDVTIDDVAFHVSQELQEFHAKEDLEKKKRLDENRKRAPVTASPGGSGSSNKPMTLDDVKRLAGRQV